MIKIIILLAKKSEWLNNKIKNFIQIYNLHFPVIAAPIKSKEFEIESCKKDLERVMTYEKLGSKSGLPKPRIIHQPK